MRQIEDRFNHQFHYPWVFLNDEPFTPEFRVLTTGMASGEVEYGLIDESEWSTPSWIDTPKAQRAMEDMVKADVIYGGSVSYRYASPYPPTHVSPSISSKLGLIVADTCAVTIQASSSAIPSSSNTSGIGA